MSLFNHFHIYRKTHVTKSLHICLEGLEEEDEMDRRENEGEGKGWGGGTPLGRPKPAIQKWWDWRRDSWLLHKICEVYFLDTHFKFNRDITVKII